MAIRTTSAAADRIEVAAASSLDNLSEFTWMMWVRPTTTPADSLILMSKAGGGGTGFEKQLIVRTGLAWQFDRNTSGAVQVARTNTSAGSILTVNGWNFIAAVVPPVGTGPKLYLGTATTPVAEVAGYSTTPAGGSGTARDESDQPLRISNGWGSMVWSVPADFGPVAVVARQLTLAELQAWQFAPHVLPDMRLLLRPGDNGLSTQRDLSGHGNHGTVTNGTVAADPPLPRWRRAWVAAAPASTGGIEEADGAASGSAVVAGIGAARALGMAVAAGGATALGVAAAMVAGVGAAAGAAAASAPAATIIEAVATASGLSTTGGIGCAWAGAVGSAQGVALGAGVGAATVGSVALSAGAASVSGGAGATGGAVGGAAGQATTGGAALAITSATGSAACAATVSANSGARAAVVGTGAGLATVSGAGDDANATGSTGESEGVATATGVGAARHGVLGASAGSSATAGHGAAIVQGTGTSTGVSTAAPAGGARASAAGAVEGLATVAGVAAAHALTTGTTAGTATCTGQGANAAAGALRPLSVALLEALRYDVALLEAPRYTVTLET